MKKAEKTIVHSKCFSTVITQKFDPKID